MAHFAELDNNNIVLRVVVIANDDLLDKDGVEQESLGIQVCKNIFGTDTKWVQTSYNNNFRKKYANIGDNYDPIIDVFYNLTPPYASWTLDSNYDWQPPVPRPTDGGTYVWNESDLSWTLVDNELPT
jgi:hypothetical protein